MSRSSSPSSPSLSSESNHKGMVAGDATPGRGIEGEKDPASGGIGTLEKCRVGEELAVAVGSRVR